MDNSGGLTMTAKERVNATIDRKPVDCVPYSFDFTWPIANKLASHYGIDFKNAPYTERWAELYSLIGDNFLYVSAKPPDEIDNESKTSRDEFGVVRDNSGKNSSIGNWPAIVSSPLSDALLDNYAFPDGAGNQRFSWLDTDALKKQDRFVIVSLMGLFDLCWCLRGFENFMMDLIGDERFANILLDKTLDYCLGIVSKIPDCVDGVRVGEDWGLQKGMIFGADLWRKLLKPRLKVLYEAIRKKNLRVLIHTCGDISEIFPDIIEAGVEIVHPIQPEAMDVAMLQREYGRYITMHGGIGTQSTLIYGSPKDVIAEARNILNLFKDGGYIFGPAGGISADTELRNVLTLIDIAMAMQI